MKEFVNNISFLNAQLLHVIDSMSTGIPTVNLGHDKAALREGKKAEDLARAERGRVRRRK